MLIWVTNPSSSYLRVLYLITVSREKTKYPYYTRQHQENLLLSGHLMNLRDVALEESIT